MEETGKGRSLVGTDSKIGWGPVGKIMGGG